jgi:hypothetical protein
MVGRLDELIAVASGTKAQVAGWTSLLRAESIGYVIATSCQIPDDDTPDHAEIWVHGAEVESARTILLLAPDGRFLW